VRARAREILDRLGATIDVDAVVGTLSVAEQQLVEISKALNRRTRILIMDEPSAVLGEDDLERLFQVVRSLQAEGIGIVYISHRMREIFALADEVTVLKDGRYVATRPVAGVTMDELVRLMIGRDLTEAYPKREPRIGEVLLEVKNLRRSSLVHDVSFQVRAGEIVGFAGITGSGRTEVVRAIFGADRHSAEMRLAGRPYRPRSPTEAIQRGVALVTEDRKAHGLFLKLDVTTNTTIAALASLCRAGVIRRGREQSLVKRMIQDLRIKTPSADFIVANMSGGNQQKVILARWLAVDTRVLIMDEPTRGIDVGAKAEIYQLMNDLTARGVGILMISSELPEVLGMSDRVLVMQQGTIVGELSRAQASEEAIMKFAVGHLPAA
jgi:ribose transport system ATP-binding protein